MLLRAVLLLSLALVWSGCGGCPGIGCSQPLSLDISTPADMRVAGTVSIQVDYDGERRTISCDGDDCTVTCPGAECPDRDRDIAVSTHLDDDGFVVGIELSIGHLSERDGESSCRGAEDVTIDVTIGDTRYERIELLDLSYERSEEHGGPGCGVVDRREAAIIPLQPV